MTRDELVERMSEVFRKAPFGKSMSSSLDVAIDELLDSADPDETWVWHEKLGIPELDVVNVIAAYRLSRRAKLERVKTPEERVTIHDNLIGNWFVSIDGAQKPAFGFGQKEDAEIYRLGLIQQLKEKP